ncbi:MAG: HPF/RaiA family ribosome-associated protein [Sulfuritalea sp.]|jgi:ribosome-associated translation inhibitor RaiA|nr:HPF/RaiA family ribosome-associated protein [Sulfuritalea sp.]MDP1983760.1 HPF/RaiA family ribosome-associated protein [Sulfuritalea sp.]
MQVQVRVKGLIGASRLRAFATNKLNVALSRFSHAVQDVSIRMSDINGPDRGGADKLCRVVLSFKNDSVVVVEELGANMMEVIDRVSDRLHHTVSKQLSHMAKIDRAGMRRNSLAVASA